MRIIITTVPTIPYPNIQGFLSKRPRLLANDLLDLSDLFLDFACNLLVLTFGLFDCALQFMRGPLIASFVLFSLWSSFVKSQDSRGAQPTSGD